MIKNQNIASWLEFAGGTLKMGAYGGSFRRPNASNKHWQFFSSKYATERKAPMQNEISLVYFRRSKIEPAIDTT